MDAEYHDTNEYCGRTRSSGSEPRWKLDLENALYEHLTLLDHGDGREQEWARLKREREISGFDSYEVFWRSHIAPLTLRTAKNPEFRFIRPGLDVKFHDLADGSYAVFFHLSNCHRWADRINAKVRERERGATDALYCFFSHASSLLYAATALARGVNALLVEPTLGGQCAAFMVSPDREDWWIKRCCALGGNRRYKQLAVVVTGYRNFLIHDKPIFLQSQLLPKREHPGCPEGESHHLDRFLGLAAVGKAARSRRLVEQCYEPIGKFLNSLLADMNAVMDNIYDISKRRLDGAGQEYRTAQKTWTKEDKELTPDDFAIVRNFGRASDAP